MDIIEIVKQDLHQQKEAIDALADKAGQSGCQPEDVSRFADRFRSEGVALKKSLMSFEVSDSCQSHIDHLEQVQSRINDLVSDLESDTCKASDYPEKLASIQAEMSERNSLAHLLFSQIETEVPEKERATTLTTYERLREIEADGAPFQQADRPHKISSHEEMNRLN